MMNLPVVAHTSTENAAPDAAETTKITSDLLGQFLTAQEEMSVHAKRNHIVTLGGVIVTAFLSLSSVCVSVYALNTTPKLNPASVAYQHQMREMTQSQLNATQDQTRALQALSHALLTEQSLSDAQQKESIERLALDHKP